VLLTEDECYLLRFPYMTAGDRECCGDATFRKSLYCCSEDENVKDIGSC
jgi:hypothetical protein